MPEQDTGAAHAAASSSSSSSSSSQSRKRKPSPSLMQEPQSSSQSAYQQSTITDHFSPVRSQSPASATSCVHSCVHTKRSRTNPPSAPSVTSKKPLDMTSTPPPPLPEEPMKQFVNSRLPAGVKVLFPCPHCNEGPLIFSRRVYREEPPKPTLAQLGMRRIQVKNLREPNREKFEKYYHTTWEALDKALESIFKKEEVKDGIEVLYRAVQDLCGLNKSPQLYEQLKGRMKDYISTQLKPKILEDLKDNDNIETVRLLYFAWTQWEKQMIEIRSIFLFLDRSYLYASPQRDTLDITGNHIFREHILESSDLSTQLLRGICALFEQDRESDGENFLNHELLLSAMRMVSGLGLYSKKFEPLFVQTSREYYAQLTKRLSQTHSLATYIKECVSQIKKEGARCDEYHVEPSTKRQIIAVMDDEMIRNNLAHLTDKERVHDLLLRRDSNSLQALYKLLQRACNPGEELKAAWQAYIVKEGTSILEDKEKESEMVRRLLDLKGTLESMWQNPLEKNETIGFALRESFSTFINARKEGASIKENSKPAEMIAKYIDQLLRNGAKNLPPVAGVEHIKGDDDAELAYRLELVLNLFRFVQGKDVFEAFYKKDLARRLLMGRSASDDAERLMLSKLKTECGGAFTNNLEAMFKDMNLSRESVASFNATKVGAEYGRKTDLHVNILNQAAWPSYPEVAVNIPHAHVQHFEAFAKFYTSKHQGRKLTWRHALSHCVLVADFPKGKKELALSAFQAVVLLAFNDAPGSAGTLHYRDLKTASGLPDPELKRTLQSLACGKVRVLLKSPKGRDVEETDKFQVNANFTSPQFRVKINQIQLRETKQDNQETHEAVEMDRKFETQAAIIRIMKSRRTIRHVDLIQQTIEQTKHRGTLDVTLIKQNIEKLIDKDYMERGEDDTYLYVA